MNGDSDKTSTTTTTSRTDSVDGVAHDSRRAQCCVFYKSGCIIDSPSQSSSVYVARKRSPRDSQSVIGQGQNPEIVEREQRSEEREKCELIQC